ncbi:aromatic acid exporter family protein [Amycolatopsis sp. QT-25]|uniref:FUSC family protein n=1 Tax=Amycolatopsis sp. QT-25 TaxID=3034022 RepID=UPI0023ECAAB9|nr:aromatic acid exporter family protein [Amycolatopsis sp. QT-25]WET82365.1 aromatic acid exporter family protein [Amycolatopsis sp. QT-25]
MDHRSRWAAPFAWVARAFRVPGEERRSLVQTAKAAAAAMIAWIIATSVLRLPQPFLAPYAAVFLVQATVYRSLRGWAEQVGAVGVGVLLAAGAGQLIPSVTVALGLVVFIGLLIGAWRGFGDSGVWVGITGMLLISYGNATEPILLADRLLETALGAGIGAVLNAVILPPLHGERLRAATSRLASAIADLLDETAALVRDGEPPEATEALYDRVDDVRSLVAEAEDAIGWTREGRYLNLRGRREQGEGSLPNLISLWQPLAQLIDAVSEAARSEEPFRHPGEHARGVVGDLLEALAEVARSGDADELDRCRELVDEIDQLLLTPTDEVTTSLGLGTMALPARRLVQRLRAD